MLHFVRKKNIGLYKFTVGMLLLTTAAAGFVFVRIWYKGSMAFSYLVWNIFLAWVPYCLSVVLTHYDFKYKILRFITAFFWIMFYPNAPYIITDFIHLSASNFYRAEHLAFNSGFNIWYGFFLITIFVVIGIILAYTSLNLVHSSIKKYAGEILGWAFIFIISILDGYAIYIGRFIRVNSWEIVTDPIRLMGLLLENINVNSLVLSTLFGTMVFLIYIAFYMLRNFHLTEAD